MSAPFGHATVPPSRKKRVKYSGSLSGSKIGPVSGRLGVWHLAAAADKGLGA